MEVGVGPLCSVSKVSGSSAKKYVPVDRSYARRLVKQNEGGFAWAGSRKKHTPIEQKHRLSWHLGAESCWVVGAEEVIRG